MRRLTEDQFRHVLQNRDPESLDLVSPEYVELRKQLPVMPEGYFSLPLPTGAVVSEGAKHYAWVSTPRWTGKPEDALRDTAGAIAILDIGSAFPIYAELLRSLAYERAYRRARDIVSGLAHERFIPQRVTRSLGGVAIANFAQERMLSSKGVIRNGIIDALRTAIYCIPENAIQDCTDPEDMTHILAGHVLYELLTSTHITKTINNPNTYEGRRGIDVELIEVESTVWQRLSATPIRTRDSLRTGRSLLPGAIPDTETKNRLAARRPLGDTHALRILDSLSCILGSAMNYRGLNRPYRVVSIDAATVEDILNDSITSFDPSTRATGIFTRASQRLAERLDHEEADLLSYLKSCEDGSKTYIVSTECFPYFFGSKPEDTIEVQQEKMRSISEIMDEIVRVLQPGGRFVAIPMNIKGNDELDAANFNEIRKQLLDAGNVEIIIREYSESQLRAFIDQADSGAFGLSPMIHGALEGGSLFKVLELKKVAANKSTIPLKPSARVPEAPGPTQ